MNSPYQAAQRYGYQLQACSSDYKLGLNGVIMARILLPNLEIVDHGGDPTSYFVARLVADEIKIQRNTRRIGDI